MEERIVELEIRFTHQQRMLEELSEVLHEQSRAIAKLNADLAALRAQKDAGPEEQPGNEPPPHY
jgi:SlyX protein